MRYTTQLLKTFLYSSLLVLPSCCFLNILGVISLCPAPQIRGTSVTSGSDKQTLLQLNAILGNIATASQNAAAADDYKAQVDLLIRNYAHSTDSATYTVSQAAFDKYFMFRERLCALYIELECGTISDDTRRRLENELVDLLGDISQARGELLQPDASNGWPASASSVIVAFDLTEDVFDLNVGNSNGLFASTNRWRLALVTVIDALDELRASGIELPKSVADIREGLAGAYADFPVSDTKHPGQNSNDPIDDRRIHDLAVTSVGLIDQLRNEVAGTLLEATALPSVCSAITSHEEIFLSDGGFMITSNKWRDAIGEVAAALIPADGPASVRHEQIVLKKFLYQLQSRFPLSDTIYPNDPRLGAAVTNALMADAKSAQHAIRIAANVAKCN
jgi:hypothetical protein